MTNKRIELLSYNEIREKEDEIGYGPHLVKSGHKKLTKWTVP